MDYSLYGLGSAYRGMAAAQAALNTMGNNISNANTDGYSRQRVEAVGVPAAPVISFNTPVSLAQIGGGVEIKQIVRERDQFLDLRMRAESSTLGANQTLKDQVDEIQAQFQEPGDSGLSSVMTKFFNAWDQLAVNPESSAARSEVRAQGLAITNTFNALSTNLNRMRVEADSQVQAQVAQINGYVKNIAELNLEIAAGNTLGAQPNALMDQRDKALDDLSKLIAIQTSVQQDGKVFVYFQGRGLVDSDHAEPLAVQPNSEGKYVDVTFRGQPISSKALGGSIGALIQTRDEIIGRNDPQALPASPALPATPGGILHQLDQLANQFASKVNAYHKAGTDLRGGTGNSFFVNNDPLAANPAFIGAGNLMVNGLIQNGNAGLDYIAAGRPAGGNPPGPGDNQTAQQIANVRSEAGFGSTTETLDDYYRTFLSNLGVVGQQANRQAQNQTTLIHHLQDQRESVSGVNLDQEMTDMVRYQHAYNASAKVLSMFDQVLDKLINGIVQ